MRKLIINFFLLIGILGVNSSLFGQNVEHYNGAGTTGWVRADGVTVAYGPNLNTGDTIFYVDNGTTCTIGNANVESLIINDNGSSTTSCTISSFSSVTAGSVTVFEATGYANILTVDGTLNVISLSIGSVLNGAGILNLSAGISPQTITGTNGGILVSDFNLLSGTIYVYALVVDNLKIASGTSLTILNYTYTPGPSVADTMCVSGSFTSNYNYSPPPLYISTYFVVTNLIINSNGSYNTSSAGSIISNSLEIGGVIASAANKYSYQYNFSNSGSPKNLTIFGNANLKFSDLTAGVSGYKYIKNLDVKGGSFTIDEPLTTDSIAISGGTVNISQNSSITTLNIKGRGSFVSTATSSTPITLSVSTIDSIEGRLILPNATLSPLPTSFNLTGTNSALGYFINPIATVTLSGTSDTIRNCTLGTVTIPSSINGTVSNNSPYSITTISTSGNLTIPLLRNVGTISITGGTTTLTGETHVSTLVDLTGGTGSLISNGNLTMLDGSNLLFNTDAQVTDNITWQRKYGSTGWIYFGSPFPGLSPNSIQGAGSQLYVNQYEESLSTERWVGVSNSQIFNVGQGYILAMKTDPTKDTLDFIGIPTVDAVLTQSLPYTTNNGSCCDFQRGYNLIANPYTAPINTNTFLTDNSKFSSIYLWYNQGENSGEYVSYNGSIETPDLITQPLNYLAPNQGFFVKVSAGDSGTSVIFQPHEIELESNTNFLRSDPVINYLRLLVNDSLGNKNDCVLLFNDSAKVSSIVTGLDIFKLISSNYPIELYSLKGTEYLSIQAQKPITSNLTVPIGLILAKNTKVTFAMNNFDALSSDITPYILDSITHQTVSLRETSLSVSLQSGTINTRFYLILKSGNITSVPVIEQPENAFVYLKNGSPYIQIQQESQQVHVYAFDILGRLVDDQICANVQGPVELNGYYQPNNVYIFKITGNNLNKTQKLLIP